MLQEVVDLGSVADFDLLFVSVHLLYRKVVCLFVDTVACAICEVHCEVCGCVPRALALKAGLSMEEGCAIEAGCCLRPLVACCVVAV